MTGIEHTNHPASQNSSACDAPAPVPPRGSWLALAGALLGVFMQMLDTTIVNIALPDLTVELGASTAQQLFVLSVYTLAFACTLLTASTLGGRYGRRRLFMSALIAFTVASVLCGVSRTPTELIVFRGLQGVSAALMSAQTLALITALFAKPLHPRIFGIYGAVAGVAAMLGPAIGGVLISADIAGWGWRTIFFVNVPIGVVGCLLAAGRLPQMRDGVRGRPDVVGVVLSSAGLFGLLYPLAVGREQGWPPQLWAMLAGSAVLLLAFAFHERRLTRTGGRPLLRTDLFMARRFTVGLLLSLMFFSVFAGFFFTVSVSTQFGLGYSPLRTGMLALPFAIGAIVGSVSSGVLAERLGASTVLNCGAMVVAVGFGWLAVTLAPDSATLSVPAVIAPLLIGGAGTGLFVAPLQTTILADTAPETVGSASGCVPTVQQIGASIGLAVVTMFFFGQVAAQSATAVPAAGSNLAVSLETTSIDPAVRGLVVDRFTRCASAQLTSPHPDRPAPGCATQGERSGIVGRLTAQTGPQIHAASREVAARTFVGAFRSTLWVLATAAVVVAGLCLGLRRPRPAR
ncbi:MFS transporter [Gordonia sp. L191]|uniref:MFS transporter n=1 Tax=Gordonia sp. L191 TaxID=2982699 RepID=UPI0024C0859E|nr:MFS transporter [Gordonia sp. L191]WHU49829.1 MFS transporter [Gordonia sp. L191]